MSHLLSTSTLIPQVRQLLYLYIRTYVLTYSQLLPLPLAALPLINPYHQLPYLHLHNFKSIPTTCHHPPTPFPLPHTTPSQYIKDRFQHQKTPMLTLVNKKHITLGTQQEEFVQPHVGKSTRSAAGPVDTWMHSHTHACTHTRTQTRMYTHTQHTRTHTHTHTHTRAMCNCTLTLHACVHSCIRTHCFHHVL